MKVLHGRPDVAPSFVTSVAAESAESRRGSRKRQGDIFCPRRQTQITRDRLSVGSPARDIPTKTNNKLHSLVLTNWTRCFPIDVNYDSKSELDKIVLFFLKKTEGRHENKQLHVKLPDYSRWLLHILHRLIVEERRQHHQVHDVRTKVQS